MDNPILVPGWPRAWPCQKWSFQSLAELLQDKELSCRIWKKSIKAQVFETNCHHLNINLSHFCDWLEEKPSSDNPLFPYTRTDYHCYIDYKYMKDMFASVPEVFDDVRWCDFGLTNFNGSDSTIWIGSEGSNTPCHQDSYGFNLVTQIQGRKMWILFPPEDAKNLYSTRVPYEESSVFSQVDVKNPDLHMHPNFQHSHPVVVILKPGESLYVPNLWWHYVESLEPSISINVWVPLDRDKHQHLTEAITRCLATCLIANLDSDEECDLKSQLLNPTEDLFSPRMNLLCLKTALEKVVCSHSSDGNERENIQLRNFTSREENDSYDTEKKNSSSHERHNDDSHFEKFERWIQNCCKVLPIASLSSLSHWKRSGTNISSQTNKKHKGDVKSQGKYQESEFPVILDDGNPMISQENIQQEENDAVKAVMQDSHYQIKKGGASCDSSDSHSLLKKNEFFTESSYHSSSLISCDSFLPEGSCNTKKHKIHKLTSLPFNEYLSVVSNICRQVKSASSDFEMEKYSSETFPPHDKESDFSTPSLQLQVTRRKPVENQCNEVSAASDSSIQQIQADSQTMAHSCEDSLTESDFIQTFVTSVLHPDVITQISLVLKENYQKDLHKNKRMK